MFSKICAHCGKTEILHIGLKDLIDCILTGQWPDDEYREDKPHISPDLSLEQSIKILYTRKKGYLFSLEDCPGFKYKKEHKKYLIDLFCNCAPDMLDYLPEEWREEAKSKLSLLDEKKRKEEDKKLDNRYPYRPSQTIIFFDERLGRSSVALYE